VSFVGSLQGEDADGERNARWSGLLGHRSYPPSQWKLQAIYSERLARIFSAKSSV
jgi:hypothetical protein